MKSTTHTQRPVGIREADLDSAESARLAQHSQDLARQDGRAESRASDRELAWGELTGPDADPAQEIPTGAEELVTWDASPEQAGHLIPEIEADDEADVAAAMAVEGSGEAEQELRRAANSEAD